MSESATRADLDLAQINAKQTQTESINKLKQLTDTAQLAMLDETEKTKRLTEIGQLQEKIVSELAASMELKTAKDVKLFYLTLDAHFQATSLFEAKRMLEGQLGMPQKAENTLTTTEVDSLINAVK